MPDSIDTVTQQLIDAVTKELDDLDKTSTAVKNLKTFAEAVESLTPDPEPDPEPTGVKAFFKRNEDNLFKFGGTAVAVVLIAIIESKGEVIFRSKASKFI